MLKDPAIQECDKDAVIQMIEEMEGYRKIVECVSQGSDIEVEQKLQWYLAKGQSEVVECGHQVGG